MAGRAAASGLVSYDPAADTYGLSGEAVMALADDGSPVFTARAMNAVASFYTDIDELAAAFRGTGATSWADHDPRLFQGTEWLFLTGTGPPGRLDRGPGRRPGKLKAGARVADVGCGHGASVVVMADAYPNSRFSGFDFHQPSIATARTRAEQAA